MRAARTRAGRPPARRPRAGRALVALLAVPALALAGCSGSAQSSEDATASTSTVPLSEVSAVDSPRTYEGPSTAMLPDASVEPVATDPQQTLPATVTSDDQDGEEQVEVTDTSRVLAIDISGSIAQTVYGLGLGDSLVGRDQSTTFPGAEDLPVVTGDGHSINAEAVLELNPTLIITDGTIGPRDVVEQMRDAGVTVVFVDNEASFEGASSLATQVGEVLGVPEQGEQLAEQVQTEVEQTRTEIERLAPTTESEKVRMIFLYIRGGSGVYYLFGEESGADDLIDGLGGIDIASEQGWEGMRPMTDEAVTAADPDLVLVMSGGLESTGGIDGLLEEKPALALTSAGEHRRFVDMADGDVLSFGPRSADVLDALARAVYAPEQGS